MIGQQVWARLQLLFAQGVGLVVGASKVQVRVLDEETLDNINRVEPYGFSYRPKAGCQTYLAFPSGDRSYGVALIIGDKRYQMELVEGEIAIHDDEQNWVHIKRGGIIEVKASTKVLADTPMFETTKDAKIGGNLTVAGQTSSVGGYFGDGGGAAQMKGGADVTGELRVNGKDVSDKHTHTSTAPGTPTSDVN
ncbi:MULTISPECIES: phage baseplate assembly protein domain-containing protein [Ralstonia solanacearum species complex]|uniref:Phage baseplate assembly protein V subfamily n=2 Tax=Ralstonia solanacearum TaxID=305 RepID=A0AB33VD25_RALSU|nr:phage baseplate assembly protein [Ralstonia solanacearum]ALF87449.1 Bacteriophage Mu Gp45 protein [Ralstonia solanacearum]ATI26974.1 phage baseplate protein [Ralstonia solanacearum]ATJ85742.1 phage baseplate protein [Ralstonia solanacearum]EAP72794.1 phage baseplate assembly protein V subfamily [Ralstonia solanacearum UW551]KEI32979.1 phage baseplate assembly protein V subfamily [Ralstonia solanacearum]